MNYNKEKLKTIKEYYEHLAFKLSNKTRDSREKKELNSYNTILDLIEDMEELNGNRK